MKFKEAFSLETGERLYIVYANVCRPLYVISKPNINGNDMYCVTANSSSWYRNNLDDAKTSCIKDWESVKTYVDVSI